VGLEGRHVKKAGDMEVIVYTRPDCDSSRRIKEILEDRGVAFQEHVCADGKVDGKDLRGLDIGVQDVPLTVIDGVPISGMNRSQIEQAIGWIGF
jgi:glutaredoxin